MEKIEEFRKAYPFSPISSVVSINPQSGETMNFLYKFHFYFDTLPNLTDIIGTKGLVIEKV